MVIRFRPAYMRISGYPIALALLCVGTLLTIGQEALELPPLPSELPISTNARVRRVVPSIPNAPAQRQISLPQFPRAARTNAVSRSYQPLTVADTILQWDQVEKEFHAQPGELHAPFTFAVTNVSGTNVVINWVRPSCGCTVAKLPPTPWTLKPGDGGLIELGVDLRGKYGLLSKYVSVDTSEGQKMLLIKVHIPNQPAAPAGMDSRARNMQLAMADRQVVFRGDCAKCHLTPTVGKVKGEEIYQAACAICHDAPHRATMVPDLRASGKATGKEYWAHWITHGKPGTLMPAFAKGQGGPLSQEQIDALAEFMFEKFPRADASATSTAAAGAGNPAAARN